MAAKPHRDLDLTWEQLRARLREAGARPDTLDHFDEIMSRRKFFGLVGRGGAAAALAGFGAGTAAVVDGLFGTGLIPVSWAQEAGQTDIEGKPGMTVHNTRPINGEFAPHLLDDDITPTERHFVRNNALVPERAANQDPQGWTLKVDGEVDRALELSLSDLEAMAAVTLPLMVECGGNGRANFEPPVRGNPWNRGAVACAEWTGVRLRDVLEKAGLKDSAVYTGHYGEDPPIGQAEPFSRGIPIDKAMEEHTLVAYKMNGEPIAGLNGYPVRIVVPGWVGSASQKWLTRIWVRNQIHDAEKMMGYSYRVPAYPVVPGSRPPEEDMVIATSWVIKSMITRPEPELKVRRYADVPVRGHAWAGDGYVGKVEISTDFGQHWQTAELRQPPNRYAWYTWETRTQFPQKGYYEIWARAYDTEGNRQPIRQPWNPKGYLGNVIHRVPVLVDL